MGAAGFPGVRGNRVPHFMGFWRRLESGVVPGETPAPLRVQTAFAVRSPRQRLSGATGRRAGSLRKPYKNCTYLRTSWFSETPKRV